MRRRGMGLGGRRLGRAESQQRDAPIPGARDEALRIQVHEDGVSIDQIVLSAVRYRTTRPGTAKNDTVILEEIR